MCDKAFNIAKNRKYGYQHGLASIVYKFFDKKSTGFQINLLVLIIIQVVLLNYVKPTISRSQSSKNLKNQN